MKVDNDETSTPPDPPPADDTSTEHPSSIGGLTSALVDLLTTIIILMRLVLELAICIVTLMLSLTAAWTFALQSPTCACQARAQSVQRDPPSKSLTNDVMLVTGTLINTTVTMIHHLTSLAANDDTTSIVFADTSVTSAAVEPTIEPSEVELNADAPSVSRPTSEIPLNNTTTATAESVSDTPIIETTMRLPSVPVSIVIPVPPEHLTPSQFGPPAPLPPYSCFDPEEHLHGLNLHELTWADIEISADELEELSPDSLPISSRTYTRHDWSTHAYDPTNSSYVPGVLGQDLNTPVPGSFQTPDSINTRHLPIIDPRSSHDHWYVVTKGIRIGVFSDWYVEYHILLYLH
jgi:hypothetical protein